MEERVSGTALVFWKKGVEERFCSEYGEYVKGEKEQWTFEPHIAERVFEDLVEEYEILVLRDEWLDRRPGEGVVKKGEKLYPSKCYRERFSTAACSSTPPTRGT